MSLINKLGKLKSNARTNYRGIIAETPIEDTCVLVEPQQGRSLNGNMYYILLELCANERYRNLMLYCVAKPGNETLFRTLLDNAGAQRVQIVTRDSERYIKLLAACKYLITDIGFPPYYVKREGQILWNTWHGTPLKTLGRDEIEECALIGNMQKNLMQSDFLSFPNKYTQEHMISCYMLDQASFAHCLLAGYPRNTAFFEPRQASSPIVEPTKTRMYAYLPTHRYSTNEDDAARIAQCMFDNLDSIDASLEDGEELFVSLHPVQRDNIDFSKYAHVQPFPADEEMYCFLNRCDALVTDYSSVQFDFALTRRKIILFAYDKEEYLANRGTYLPLEQLPFPIVQDVETLVAALRAEKSYDDASFLDTYCKFDSPSATSSLCKQVLCNEDAIADKTQLQPNGKKNVLIALGEKTVSKIPGSVDSALASIDPGTSNVFLMFKSGNMRGREEYLLSLPKSVSYFPIAGSMTLTPRERFMHAAYARKALPFAAFDKNLDEAYRFELCRRFGNITWDTVICFEDDSWRDKYLLSKISCVHRYMVGNGTTGEPSKLPLGMGSHIQNSFAPFQR